MLINVTSFFRDPEMFEDLKREVFPAIVNGKPDGPPVRVWVPGCSTGQEAYSLAMALLEFCDTAKTQRSIQVFGTDLGDPSFLDKARAGVYPESIEAEVSPERLDGSSSRRTGTIGSRRACGTCASSRGRTSRWTRRSRAWIW